MYINVYKDKKGEIHYSSEEMSIYKNTIDTVQEAVDEVIKFRKLNLDLEYFTTLAVCEKTTEAVNKLIE